MSAHSRRAYVRSNGSVVSATHVTGYCRTKGEGDTYWSERLVRGKIEFWPHKKEKFKDWSRKDIETVLDALSEVNKALWEPVQIYRAVASEATGNPATSAEGLIVLYDEAFKNVKNLPRYLSHELAHQKYRNMKAIESEGYLRVAQWEVIKEKQESKFKANRERFVARDGDLSPEEDFANNLEYFIYEPQKLKFKNPSIFNWFQIEYGPILKKGAKDNEK